MVATPYSLHNQLRCPVCSPSWRMAWMTTSRAVVPMIPMPVRLGPSSAASGRLAMCAMAFAWIRSKVSSTSDIGGHSEEEAPLHHARSVWPTRTSRKVRPRPSTAVRSVLPRCGPRASRPCSTPCPRIRSGGAGPGLSACRGRTACIRGSFPWYRRVPGLRWACGRVWAGKFVFPSTSNVNNFLSAHCRPSRRSC